VQLLPFLAVAVVVVITPGVDMALVTKNALVHGRGQALATLPELLVLGALFNAMGVIWLTSYALLASRGRVFLQRTRVKRALDYVSGIVLVGLGLRLALERRG
jgi:threonine/homoserine/homoserine lactone efflux protein